MEYNGMMTMEWNIMEWNMGDRESHLNKITSQTHFPQCEELVPNKSLQMIKALDWMKQSPMDGGGGW